MQPYTFLVAVAAATITSVTAVQLPADAADGVWVFDGASTGAEKRDDASSGWTLVEEYNSTEHAKRLAARGFSRLSRRFDYNAQASGCGSDTDYLNGDELLIAQSLLTTRCEGGSKKLNKNQGIFAKYGSTCVYACSYWNDGNCTPYEIEKSMWALTHEVCHSETRVGYLHITGGADKMYGRDWATAKMCW